MLQYLPRLHLEEANKREGYGKGLGVASGGDEDLVEADPTTIVDE